MFESIDFSLVDWSRAQFALTAMYHWLFVPLTLGTTFIIAIMETIYVKTGKPEWKKMTKFWMTLFGINFAIGVATGIILEFEFGTNWSNYSWFVGDIFGAPLAIEGIMAFFLESTFIAVMFFGWNKVSPKFHLLSSWLVAIGANLSALWILVANAWMQSPVGTTFNPETARNEMTSFWEVLFSPVAINKFLHTITSGFVLSALFVIGISAWFLLRRRHVVLARKSILVAAIFGVVSSLALIGTGDGSAKQVAKLQPMKLAAMEGLYNGSEGVGLIAIGAFKSTSAEQNEKLKDLAFKIEIPKFLSFLAYGKWNAFVPGVNDLINGNPERGILPVAEKMKRGKQAIEKLSAYKDARNANDENLSASLLSELTDPAYQENYFRYLGYGHIQDSNFLIPNIPLVFYSFHLMVALGFLFVLIFILSLWWVIKGKLETKRWFLYTALFMIPLAYLASELGWVVAELGRQPWVIQDLMPTTTAVSRISTTSVQITFGLFAVIFTTLLLAEVKIMLKQIKIGPKDEGGKQS
ncbi:MAG TPA: cytochrome ubiquinol oxidase subunit I [Prolixibacteraceae bacterium]|nr:cytochrome ubiquinol oxidase subunit I [Prolixibacteraceae bacterium]